MVAAAQRVSLGRRAGAGWTAPRWRLWRQTDYLLYTWEQPPRCVSGNGVAEACLGRFERAALHVSGRVVGEREE